MYLILRSLHLYSGLHNLATAKYLVENSLVIVQILAKLQTNVSCLFNREIAFTVALIVIFSDNFTRRL